MIVDAVRSPMCCRGARGALARLSPAATLAQVMDGLLDRCGLKSGAVTRVLTAGDSRATRVAREACDLAGLGPDLPVQPLTELRSSKRAIIQTAVREVTRADLVLVVGVASRELETDATAAETVRRGITAELVAARWKLGRGQLDDYAEQSRERAREVAEMGEFDPETIPVSVWAADSRFLICDDQTVRSARRDGAVDHHPLFHDAYSAKRFPEIGWHLTAGNCAQPADGAAAAILVRERRAGELGLRPLARVVALAECPDELATELCGPVRATQRVLDQMGLDPDELDHYEVQESFASVPLAWQREFAADIDRLNPRGGAIALGQPGFASELRSLATMLSALDATGGRFGLQASEGNGTAGDALIVERIPRLGTHRPYYRGKSRNSS